MDDVACCGLGRLCARLERVVGFARGRAEVAAVRAGNAIGDDGAASLAPNLGRMTQLMSLAFCGMPLRASDGLALRAGAVARSGCRGWWGFRGVSGGAVVRAGNVIGDDGAVLLRSSASASCSLDL
jgi:hypothetical protein